MSIKKDIVLISYTHLAWTLFYITNSILLKLLFYILYNYNLTLSMYINFARKIIFVFSF